MRVKMTTLVLAVAFLTAMPALNACAQQSGRGKQEARRKASGEAGVSPMPPGRYEFNGEELGLVNPQPNALDSALTELCRRYAQSDAATRQCLPRRPGRLPAGRCSRSCRPPLPVQSS